MLSALALCALLSVQFTDVGWVQEPTDGKPKSALARAFTKLADLVETLDGPTFVKRLGVGMADTGADSNEAPIVLRHGRSGGASLTVKGTKTPAAMGRYPFVTLGAKCASIVRRWGPANTVTPRAIIYLFTRGAQRARLTYTCDERDKVVGVELRVPREAVVRAYLAEAHPVEGLPFLCEGGPCTKLMQPQPDDTRDTQRPASQGPIYVVGATRPEHAAELLMPWGIDPNDAASVVDKLGPPTRGTATEIAYPGIQVWLAGARVQRLRVQSEALPFLAERKLDRSIAGLVDMTGAQLALHFGGPVRDLDVQRGGLHARLVEFTPGDEPWRGIDVVYTPTFAFDSLPGLDLARWSQTLRSLGELPPGVTIAGDTLVVETRAKGWLAERGSGGALLASALGSAYLYIEKQLGPPKVTDIESPPELDVWWVRVPSSAKRTAAIRIRCGPSPTLCYRLEIRGEDASVVAGPTQ